MSSFYVPTNILEEGQDDDNYYYGNHLHSIVDITCAEKCFVNITKLEYSCAAELSRTVLNLHFDTNCNSVDDIEIYHVDNPDLADMIRLELLNDMKTATLSNISRRSYSNFLVYQNTSIALASIETTMIRSLTLDIVIPTLPLWNASTFLVGVSASMFMQSWKKDFPLLLFPTKNKSVTSYVFNVDRKITCDTPCNIEIMDISILSCKTELNKSRVQIVARSNCSPRRGPC